MGELTLDELERHIAVRDVGLALREEHRERAPGHRGDQRALGGDSAVAAARRVARTLSCTSASTSTRSTSPACCLIAASYCCMAVVWARSTSSADCRSTVIRTSITKPTMPT
ncbi:hypothetical protein Q0F99_01360 [Rathayibacter oskolensis]|uniref:hypothetical protein n=1 Tax=Rathayibacter oskolensis TaxID=1891671 RepID=UPI00265F78D1|nr:hypothetical protein [Rathayibacter oskolensis]WKK71854.1 hypothetical protein Q0F99_01360 [Rathayibacter oskolensis]